ncbi:MAG: hypothetical protein WCP65_02710, partial [Bacteroidota bacterium]
MLSNKYTLYITNPHLKQKKHTPFQSTALVLLPPSEGWGGYLNHLKQKGTTLFRAMPFVLAVIK